MVALMGGDVELSDVTFHVGSGVGPSDADAAEFSVEAEGDDAAVVDAVGAQAVVHVVLRRAAWAGFEARGVARGGVARRGMDRFGLYVL